jgi:beta-galactosidase
MGKISLFNDGWEFALDGGDYRPVELPHDWLIYDTLDLYKSGTGRYRRSLDTGFLQGGQRLFLRFDGVYMDCTLYVNGKTAGDWKYGYTAFEFDITQYLSHGEENELLLEVRHRSPNSRWYSGAGIYRDVSLIVKNPCHFISDGIYITPVKKDGMWDYTVSAEVESCGREYETRHTVVEGGELKTWDIEHPNLYTLRSELIVGGHVSDVVHTRFGCRETAFDPDKGFFLNGRHLKLNGVCMHHDLGALGAAVSKDAIRRQLTLLRSMGVNAVRTAHNPPAQAFMELADEMGFLVLSELTDMWERSKTEFDYARFFSEWAERDTASWIRRDRNCPSVIMWSIGNEIYDTHADAERGMGIMLRLTGFVMEHDPDGHAPVTLCSNYMAWENTKRCADVLKLVGYNYAEYLYEQHHAEHPDWMIYGGETSSTVQSRGVYRFPLRQPILADDDRQCSVLGNSSVSWGAESPEWCALIDLNTPFSMGQFLWTGQDYIGEPTPYQTKNSYFGHIDTAGFFKDSYYVFKAAWTKEPLIHIFPYWDHSPGQLIDVRAATNAHSAELFINGKSLGVIELNGRLIADWSVAYVPGELCAKAYDASGTVVAETVRRSFGDAAGLSLSSDVYGDLSFVTITAVDADGNVVENANDRVRISAEGGTLLGLDNGDSTDFDQYKTDSRRLFSGKLTAIVRSSGEENPAVTAVFDKSDVPVRKIELTVDGYDITAKVFPGDATFSDLYWRLTDAAGIDSILGTLDVSADGKSAVLNPKGDGEVWIRCAAKNGKEHFSLISQATLTIEGVGKPFIDPYTFVAGGVVNRTNAKMGIGLERGVVSAHDIESHIGFADLDFGSYGSDEFILPIFPLSLEPFEFEVWEGMPGENGAEHLLTIPYDKGSIWNTYQDVCCKLPRRLRGVTTLCLAFRQKVHVKGFIFTKYEKAFTRLNAAENDGISGDNFTVADGAVEGIGNNVSIVFNDMDFGANGARGIKISSRSPLNANSIQLLLNNGNVERREILEVSGSDIYTISSHSFTQPVCGKQTVSIVFLPGTNIDLDWINFEEAKQ